jgi:outer membrane protein assembly factor BamB
VCTDYTQGKVFIVDASGKAVWSYDAPNANDVWVLPNGNLLFNTGHGVKEVTREKEVVFSRDLPMGIPSLGSAIAGGCWK